MIVSELACADLPPEQKAAAAGYRPDVAIILATFKGARFLREQLDGFRNQADLRWKLIWRDDGSTDSTAAIMEEFSRHLAPGQVVHAGAPGDQLGIFDSYMSLLGEALDAPAVAFADQDDVWLPGKLQQALEQLRTVDPMRPAIYCGRQTLVDEALPPIGFSPGLCRQPGFPGLLLQNIGTGCTIVMNQSAARALYASKKPRSSLHDWWACLFVAAIGGTTLFDNTPDVPYRQPGAGSVGALRAQFRRLMGVLARGPAAHNAQFTSHLDALMKNEAQLSPEALRQTQQIRSGYAGTLRARLSLLETPGFRRQTWAEDALLALWLVRGDITFARRLRRLLRNRLTVFLYARALDLLRETLIAKDCWTFRLRRPVTPEVRCLLEPAAGACYSRLAIFVIFAERLGHNHYRVINGLARSGYAVALLNNRSFAVDQSYPDGVAFAVENHNVGRDFGAYLRGLRLIQAKGYLAADARIMFLNDSVIYLPGHEAVFAMFAEQKDDWIGITENHHVEYYVASWCFELSIAIINGDAFRKWSAAMMPLNNRAYLISRGEIGLSRALLRAGYKPKVLFDSTFWSALCSAIGGLRTDLAKVIPRYLRTMDRQGFGKNGILRKANQAHLFTFGGALSGLFPFLKKDILYRYVFEEYEVEALCEELATRYGDAIADECRGFLFRRGNGANLQGFAGIRWIIGVD